MNRKGLAVGLILLFIVSIVAPMVIGYKTNSTEKYNKYNLDSYHSSEVYNNEKQIRSNPVPDIFTSNALVSYKETTAPSTVLSPMNSSWPMYCHDARHTGRGPYNTIDTWAEVWRFSTGGDWCQGDITIDDNGTIYAGSTALYAIYQNGSLKWEYVTYFHIDCAPAIDENGVLYFGTIYGDYFYAINTSDGSIEWKLNSGSVFSSPVIADDGTIIFAEADNWNIVALYPNGTQKWGYHTNHVVYSSPAIGPDGTVYCGCHDTYLYALYPNNGTLKWRYKTGDWIRVSPCIADDGTIYVVSLDGYLHAVNPDGSLKWKTDVGAGTSPTIGQDGTIYCGYSKLHAINPINGSVKWTFDVCGTMRGGTPCNSIDGTIYIGTSDGGELIAVNPDGTERWRKGIGECESAPAIGKDGTIYVGSNDGYLYVFGIGNLEADANGPYYGLINQPVQFQGKAMGGYSPHSYNWNFGDGGTSDEQNPTHVYTSAGNYTVTLTVTDNTSNTSTDSTWAWIQVTNTPPDTPTINGPTKGEYGISYDYKFASTDQDGTPIWYYVDWGDDSNTGWVDQYNSGEEITLSHSWSEKGTYIIRCKAKDPYNAEGDWGTLSVTMPCSYDKPIMNFLEKILERFPHAFPILRYILGQYKTFF